jgi:hypothetical protein
MEKFKVYSFQLCFPNIQRAKNKKERKTDCTTPDIKRTEKFSISISNSILSETCALSKHNSYWKPKASF